MEFAVTWCLLLMLVRCRDMRLFCQPFKAELAAPLHAGGTAASDSTSDIAQGLPNKFIDFTIKKSFAHLYFLT